MDPRRRALIAALAAAAVRPAHSNERIVLKRIPSSGEELPAIGIGTWQTFDVRGDPAALAPLREVLKAFSEAGGRVVDSSPMYGAAESVVGELTAGLGLRERLFIATKVWTHGREQGIRQMEESFRRMRVERMDLMQVHNLADVETHTRTLKEMKEKKRIRYMGITHYTASAYGEIERLLKTGQYDFLQINYSLGEREADKRLLPLARDLKVAVIANRPFQESALFSHVKGKPLPAWAAELGIRSWAQYFLKWIVSHPALTCAIPGTGRPEHIRDNVAAGFDPLPDASTRTKMAEYFDSL
ncbi:MAG TPA: aldo/keto reductase [Burkholderiales bacterium]|jgi:diketogulonate reductase-like aldo/keto reductase|nr:aldo/keto reductase [Burkholderiales bacterium]